MKENENIPIWQKTALTIQEAALYSNIGQKKLRELVDKPRCPFSLYVGSKRLIKRKLFEKFLDEHEFI